MVNIRQISDNIHINSKNNNNVIQLTPINVKYDYLEKWNSTHYNDFYVLTLNDSILRNTLYRKGGLNEPNPQKDKYFMLLKYVQAYYDDNITTDKNKKPHLKGKWCILNSLGEEMVEFEQFSHPYIIKNSVIYSINSKYYNIETGEFYCKAFDKVESDDYLFLQNDYDNNHYKRGVMMINKKDGSYVIYSNH
jgi:hypothetical protein